MHHVGRPYLLLLVAAALACDDDPVDPEPRAEIAVETPRQYSGSDVRVRSEAFRSETSAWVILGDDTLALRRTPQSDTRLFRLPALLSGAHTAMVLLNGHLEPISFEAIGLAREPVFFAGGPVGATVRNVQGGGNGRAYFAIYSGRTCGNDAETGAYCVVNLSSPGPGRAVEGLEADDATRMRLDVPGPSYRSGHLVFEIAPVDQRNPLVYRLDAEPVPIASLPCGRYLDIGLSHTIAEISPTTCLETDWPGEIWRNGSELVIDGGFAFRDAQFRIAPGHGRVTLLTRYLDDDLAMTTWPVFDTNGGIAYTVDLYEHVPGVAFSADGTVMWVAARDRTDQWRLDELDVTSGELRRSVEFPDVSMLIDVLRDPIDGRLYVAGTDGDNAPILAFVDPAEMRIIRIVPAPKPYDGTNVYFGGILEPGGSDGRLHLLAWHAGDAGWHVWSFDRM